jgi:hypothetical protein
MITTKDCELIVVNALLVQVDELNLDQFTDNEKKKFVKAQAKFRKRLTKFRDTLLKRDDE